MFHVLEHLRDPLHMLTKVRAWLRPAGVLVIQVPNAASLQARLFGRRCMGSTYRATSCIGRRRTLRKLAALRLLDGRNASGSWRDNGPLLAASLAPGLDPFVERERLLSEHQRTPPLVTALRRATFLATVWLCTPLTLLEAWAQCPATLTVLAQKVG